MSRVFEAVGFGLYWLRYCLNNPLKYNDISGEFFGIDDAIAAFVGGVVNLTINAIQGNVTSLGAAGGYFATGAAATIATMYGGPLAGAAVLGFGNNLTTQVSQNGWQNIDWWQAGGATAMSVATSYLGGQLGSQLAKPLSKLSSSITGSPVLQGAITDGLTNSATGFVLAAGTTKLSGGSWKESWSSGGENALWGLGMGTITGGVRGYKYAKDKGLGLWSGESLDVANSNELIDAFGLQKSIDRIDNGESYPHRNDGSVFKNYPPKGQTNPLLPDKPTGYYREYVHPSPGVNGAGLQRIIYGNGGEIYYTPDHYSTFFKIK